MEECIGCDKQFTWHEGATKYGLWMCNDCVKKSVLFGVVRYKNANGRYEYKVYEAIREDEYRSHFPDEYDYYYHEHSHETEEAKATCLDVDKVMAPTLLAAEKICRHSFEKRAKWQKRIAYYNKLEKGLVCINQSIPPQYLINITLSLGKFKCRACQKWLPKNTTRGVLKFASRGRREYQFLCKECTQQAVKAYNDRLKKIIKEEEKLRKVKK